MKEDYHQLIDQKLKGSKSKAEKRETINYFMQLSSVLVWTDMKIYGDQCRSEGDRCCSVGAAEVAIEGVDSMLKSDDKDLS
ncbi:hypothetical protein SLE2022_204520 [Rubroshorea leprosula]